MAALISTKPGRIGIVNLGPEAEGPGLLSLTNPTLDALTVVITQFGSRHSVNVQFQKTLQKAVYMYAFGDHMGDAVISGIAFGADGCSSQGLFSTNAAESTEEFTRPAEDGGSLKKVIEYYSSNKLSTRLDPIKITFASKVINAYLCGCTFSADDATVYACKFSFDIKIPTSDLT